MGWGGVVVVGGGWGLVGWFGVVLGGMLFFFTGFRLSHAHSRYLSQLLPAAALWLTSSHDDEERFDQA